MDAKRMPGGKRIYNMQHVSQLFDGQHGRIENSEQRIKVCYARVSSQYKAVEFERQICDLRSGYPRHVIISDIGSGLNFNRKGTDRVDL